MLERGDDIQEMMDTIPEAPDGLFPSIQKGIRRRRAAKAYALTASLAIMALLATVFVDDFSPVERRRTIVAESSVDSLVNRELSLIYEYFQGDYIDDALAIYYTESGSTAESDR